MAFTYGFYNSIDKDRVYNANDFSSIFNGLIKDGVYATVGSAFTLSVSTDAKSVIIGTGRSWFNGTWNNIDSPYPILIEESELLLNRVDALVIDVNKQARTNAISWVRGIPSAAPTKPVLINNDKRRQWPIGYVTREKNKPTITQSNIQYVIGTDECPFVTGLLQTISADVLIAQWKAQWTEWLAAKELDAQTWSESQRTEFNTFKTQFFADMNTFKTNQEEDFVEWFNHCKAILDENAAGHLQNEIDATNDTVFKRHFDLSVDNVTITKLENGNTQIVENAPGVSTATTLVSKTDTGTLITTEVIPVDGDFKYIKTVNITKNDDNISIVKNFDKQVK